MPVQPLVSIVTPVYNGAAYIEALIFSVQAQDYPKIEHIVIDDGSKDNTVEILKKHPHLRWWSCEHRGQYATMSEGLKAAQGEIICFISADDLIANGAVRTAVHYLNNAPHADGVYGDYDYIDETGKTICPLRPFRLMPTSLYPYSLHISHSSFYLRRASLLENQLLFNSELRYVGDYEWIVRILHARLRIDRIKDSLSFVRLHTNQTTQINFLAMRAEGLAVQKHLRISPLLTSLFRKIMFMAKMIDIAKKTGIKAMVRALYSRARSG